MIRRGARGFTLVEVLVVIAIISVMIGLLLPAVQKVRAAAASAQCQNNLKQLGLANHNYASAHGHLPPGVVIGNGNAAQVPFFCSTWIVHILPYIEQGAAWERIQAAYSVDPNPFNPSHDEVRKIVIPMLGCPADSRVGAAQLSPIAGPPEALSSYLGVMGDNHAVRDGVLYADSRVRILDISDGTSQTLMVGERPPGANLHYGHWYNGGGQAFTGSIDAALGVREINLHPNAVPDCPRPTYRFEPGDLHDDCDVFHFWSLHAGGANFAFTDGSVRLLRYEVSPLMPALASRAGGEIVPLLD